MGLQWWQSLDTPLVETLQSKIFFKDQHASNITWVFGHCQPCVHTDREGFLIPATRQNGLRNRNLSPILPAHNCTAQDIVQHTDHFILWSCNKMLSEPICCMQPQRAHAAHSQTVNGQHDNCKGNTASAFWFH